MMPKSQSDVTWQHARRLEKKHHSQCLHCDFISRGRDITRLKQHLAGGYLDVAKCSKAPAEVRKFFKELLDNEQEQRFRDAKKDEFKRRATKTSAKMCAMTNMRVVVAMLRIQSLQLPSMLHWSNNHSREIAGIILDLNLSMAVAAVAPTTSAHLRLREQ
ncbi:hypothetical protein Cni_G16334 [Canna indica]|uniref:BED-type domain-containing protein n=1 Tax=Canna indica TaxID=4628 RepID=A0AAQ3QGP2_9LILI|nr:hypothetical protein Cni_G16334 [Canna indica]